ncbi:MAG: hypothetical protein PHC51_02860 [bacterium]|nr:hypothetical protein [bacterium]
MSQASSDDVRSILGELTSIKGVAEGLLQLLCSQGYDEDLDEQVALYLAKVDRTVTTLLSEKGLPLTVRSGVEELLSVHNQLITVLNVEQARLGSQLVDFHRKTSVIKTYSGVPSSIPVSITGKKKG